jgi:hypothetical protein
MLCIIYYILYIGNVMLDQHNMSFDTFKVNYYLEFLNLIF